MSRINRSRGTPGKSARRREELRRNLPKPAFDIRPLIQEPRVVNGLLVLLAFIMTAGLLVVWSREQVRAVDGRIMTDTRLNRVAFNVPDDEATEAQRAEARASAAQIWTFNTTQLQLLEASLNGLPKAVAGKTSIENVSQTLLLEYDLTNDGLEALQQFAVTGETTLRWKQLVNELIFGQLQRNPLIDSDEYQNLWAPREYTTTLKRVLRTEEGGEYPRPVDAIELIPAATEVLEPEFNRMAARAGFPSDVIPIITAKLLKDRRPILRFNAEATERLAQAAAEGVRRVFDVHEKDAVIHRAGERLDAEQFENLVTESGLFMATAPRAEVWLPRVGTMGLVAVLLSFLGVFIAVNYPRITRNWVREAAIAILIVGMLTLSTALSAQQPGLLLAAAVASSLAVAVVTRLAYDQRLAVMLSGVAAILITLSLNQGTAFLILLMVGCCTAISQLAELRHRNSLIRAAMLTAAVIGAGTVLLGLVTMPLVEGAWSQILSDATWAISASLAVGFVMLGILPSIEKLFDITTGMTLAELRDTKQPLLRQLQQKAPGTYNHSLQVANVAEAAADAIGADGLLVYVGALYHDIGKMNKPEYFVENQAGGYNKHDKLSPAMSLLVIIGHVKDGIELAREYALPRQLQHFIESHHGTTLVEYFYHAARTQAEADDKTPVDEVEFRYPGPKPRTKEAAILMLSDAVESATRAMTDPTPGRIESLVREIALKRLTDGQFDQCDLTFRELGLIEESVISRLCAIHHGRISYPSGVAGKEEDVEAKTA